MPMRARAAIAFTVSAENAELDKLESLGIESSIIRAPSFMRSSARAMWSDSGVSASSVICITPVWEGRGSWLRDLHNSRRPAKQSNTTYMICKWRSYRDFVPMCASLTCLLDIHRLPGYSYPSVTPSNVFADCPCVDANSNNERHGYDFRGHCYGLSRMMVTGKHSSLKPGSFSVHIAQSLGGLALGRS